MGVLLKDTFLGVSDRLAKQYDMLITTHQLASSGTGVYPRIHGGLSDTGDYPVEVDLITAANTTDTNRLDFTKISVPLFGDIVNAINSHITSRGGSQISTLNDYLLVSGIHVHERYAELYADVTGNELLAKHAFRADEVQMGMVTVTSSGVATFTDGTALNAGTGQDYSRRSITSDALIQYYIASGSSSTNDRVLSIIGINDEGNTISATVTIDNSLHSGMSGLIDSGKRFADVTTIQVAGGNASEVITIRSVIDRNIGI